MFESAIAINEFQVGGFQKIVADLPDDSLFAPGLGHGHPPAWIMGHLAVSGESGQRLLGGQVTHRDWLPLFGPGSSDKITASDQWTKPVLAAAVTEAYATLRTLASNADPQTMSRPNSVSFFQGTPIRTIGDCVTLLLTSHFGLHLSQLSSCRRAAGFAPLF